MEHGSDLTAARVAEFHDALLAAWEATRAPPPVRFEAGPWHGIEHNHVCNVLLWHAEERARRTDLPDAEIVACKRVIDRQDQARLAAIQYVDAALLELFGEHRAAPGARLSSETPGAMIDRLSMLSLQICHLRRAAERAAADEAGGAHGRPFAPPLRRLAAQRRDLGDCLDRLLRELADGEACFRLYAPLRHEPAQPLAIA